MIDEVLVMSVVSIVTCDEYSLIMGDSKLSNDFHGDKISKVFRTRNILLGFTGNIISIGEYLYPIFDEKMNMKDDPRYDDPEYFLLLLDHKFYRAIKENKEIDARIVTSVKIGDKYITKYYCLINSKNYRWSTETIVSDDRLRYFYLGNHCHREFFTEKINQEQNCCIENVVKIFQETLNYGIRLDNTINNEMEYKII